jgi:hypothetical protein
MAKYLETPSHVSDSRKLVDDDIIFPGKIDSL